MIGLFTSLLPGIIKLGDKFIEDKDKRNEFAFKMMDIMLNTTTYKWVDALVKLSYAGEQIVKGLIRPIGAMAMACFAAYCDVNAIELSDTAQTLLYGAPVAWGTSRHVEKRKQKPLALNDEDFD